MAFTATQKQEIKQHLGVPPTANVLDTLFAQLEADSAIAAKVSSALSRANETLENLKTAQDEADEIVEGGGAKFSYERMIAVKKSAYSEAIAELYRLFSWESFSHNLTGFINV